jgi:hypothetical protein
LVVARQRRLALKVLESSPQELVQLGEALSLLLATDADLEMLSHALGELTGA